MEALVGIFFFKFCFYFPFVSEDAGNMGFKDAFFLSRPFLCPSKGIKQNQKHSQSIEVKCTLTFPVKQLIGEAPGFSDWCFFSPHPGHSRQRWKLLLALYFPRASQSTLKNLPVP